MSKRSAVADTASLIAVLRAKPSTTFRAAELARITGVPKNFVRRRLTVQGDGATPLPGVMMTPKDPFGFWYVDDFSATTDAPHDLDRKNEESKES